MFGSVFNIEHCERHGKRHGAIELETHLQKRRLMRTSGVCGDSLWFRGNCVKSTAPIASFGAKSNCWEVLLHPDCTRLGTLSRFNLRLQNAPYRHFAHGMSRVGLDGALFQRFCSPARLSLASCVRRGNPNVGLDSILFDYPFRRSRGP